MKWRYKKKVLQPVPNILNSRIIVLTGARQTGKTTFAKKFYSSYQYISIEDPILRGQYTEMTAAQWNNNYPQAILDEVQKEPRLIESIKAVYDQFPEASYVLLGSSQLLLMQKVKESMAGRCLIVEMFPLTIPEIISNSWDDTQKPSLLEMLIKQGQLPDLLPSFQIYPDYPVRKEAFDYYLNVGGYPAIVAPEYSENERFEWLYNYIRTYLERDIRDLADFRHLEPFIKAQKIAAVLTGQLVNYSVLAKEAAISPKTAQKFLYYLELSYQVILLQPWHSNALKRLNKSPKLHFLDPGIQKTIIGKRGEVNGNEFESAIIAEIYKQCKNFGFKGNFYHLRTLDGREIDLLLETEKGYYAFEIKQTVRVNSTDARNFKGLGDILDKPLLKCFILSNDNKISMIKDNILALPAAMFLS